MEWQPIETAKVDEAESPLRVLLWIADGGMDRQGCAALGTLSYWPESQRIIPRADGYAGDWRYTHYCVVEPPK